MLTGLILLPDIAVPTVTEAEEENRAQTVETAAEDDETASQGSGIEMTAMSTQSSSFDEEQTPGVVRYKPLAESKGHPGFDGEVEPAHEEGEGLSGAQDAAIAGLVTILGLICSVFYWILFSANSDGTSKKGTTTLKWRPSTHLQWWFAMLGGAMAFLHYFFLLKAFEGAPSTVLLPLVQVASVSVLFGSSIVNLIKHEPFITPTHMLAYLLMFVGGILPACAGQLHVLLQPSFWKQSFVTFAIAAELALGMHDLMLSGCAYNPTAPSPPQPLPAIITVPGEVILGPDPLAAGPALQAVAAREAVAAANAAAGSESGGVMGYVGRRLAEAAATVTASTAALSDGISGSGSSSHSGEGDTPESFEFFIWSRLSFIATFCCMYYFSPTLWAELRDLLSGKIDRKYVALSGISEGLTIVGFYLASIAYGLFYQAGIVHAAEASLSQLLNLSIAYILFRGFGIGRSSAVDSMRIKFISFVMVTIGLFLCTFDGEKSTKAVAAAPAAGQAAGPMSAVKASAVEVVTPVVAHAAQRLLRRRRRR